MICCTSQHFNVGATEDPELKLPQICTVYPTTAILGSSKFFIAMKLPKCSLKESLKSTKQSNVDIKILTAHKWQE